MDETFWATMKVKYFYRHGFVTRDQVYDEFSGWIEVFYNRYHRHSTIVHISPVAYELALKQPTTALKAAKLTVHHLRGQAQNLLFRCNVNQLAECSCHSSIKSARSKSIESQTSWSQNTDPGYCR